MILFAALLSTAAACGGFFCSLAQPVVQAGENILFTMDGVDVTATIQIQYTGDASKFSWVLPLPSDPTAFGVASDQLFRALHQFTAPQFSLTVNYPENCPNWNKETPCPVQRELAFAGNPAPGSAPGVNIVAMGEVGPYEYTVITALASDPMGDALFAWLNANGFDQPPSSKPIVARYVGLKHRFVTLKLQKGKASGELVPIVLKYKSPSSTAMSCVPLRLTAIAASNEMPVFVWVAGKERAVPQNFVHIKPDLTSLPWEECANPGSGWSGGWGGGFLGSASLFRPFGGGNRCENEYKSLLKQTAEKFGAGKWLTTEFAGERPNGLLDAVWNTATPQVNVANLEKITSAEMFLQQLMNTLPFDLRTSPITLELIRKHIPKPDNVDANCMTDQAYYSPFNNQCLSKYLTKGFNGKAFTNDIQMLLLQPIIDSRSQLEKFSYITRLYTLMTPANMVRDPVFRFVESADKVSNVLTANFTIDCPTAPSAMTTGTVIVGESRRTVTGVVPGYCGGYTITKSTSTTIDVGDGVVELLQEDDKAPKKLKRTALANLAAVQAQDALLNDIDGAIIGTPITASCGNCNCGSIGCGCMAGNMCMTGAKCESDNVGVKKCVVSAVRPDESDATYSASLAVAVAALAVLLPTFA